MVKRPINSFVDYFLDIKPYHTKILEIIEQYSFIENLNIVIDDLIEFEEIIENTPLCNGTGFGIDFDNQCGFSTDTCCDLFTCVGGYGLIFDNSDLLVSATVNGYDNETPLLQLDGDYRYDTYLQIDSVTNNEILLKGNYSSLIYPHSLFIITNSKRLLITETIYNGVYVDGDFSDLFNNVNEFTIRKSANNDGNYGVIEAIFYRSENRTFIKTLGNNIDELDINSLGEILIRSHTKNNGVYQKTSISYDGVYTRIQLSSETPIKLPYEDDHGCIVLRTGFFPNRLLWINDGSDFSEMPEVKIISTNYDYNTDTTTIELNISMNDNISVYDLSNVTIVELRGYRFGAGFDGFNECTTPNPPHIYSTFSENLFIQIIDYSSNEEDEV